jgi:hypothetical protein
MEGPKMAGHLPRRLKGGLGAAAGVAIFGLVAATAAMTVGAWTYTVQTWTYTGSTQTANAEAGQTIHDRSLVTESSGRDMQTGYLTFDLYSTPNCTGTPLYAGPHIGYTSNGSSTSAWFTGGNYQLSSSITAAARYEWVATFYNTIENTVWSSGCGQEPVNVSPIPETFGISTNQAETEIQPGGSVSDTATVSSTGGSIRSLPAGTVTFNLYTASNCTSAVSLSNGVVALAGSLGSSAGVNGPLYTTPTSITSPRTYYWTATYKVGGTTEATSGCAAEPIQVVHQGSVTTIPTPSSGNPNSTALTDSATVTGIVDPASTDTVTFALYLQDPSDPGSCTGGTSIKNFGASALQGGTAGPWTAASSGSVTPTAAGTYLWQVQFTAVSDPNNLASRVFCGEPVTVSTPVGNQLAASTTTPVTGSGLGPAGLIAGLITLLGGVALVAGVRLVRPNSI